MNHTNPYDLHQNHSNHPTPYHLVKRGSHTACNHKHDYHDSCTLCKGKHPVSTSSDFIASKVTRETSFLCMDQRSLHAITKVYCRS
jgi:hypothetical protein